MKRVDTMKFLPPCGTSCIARAVAATLLVSGAAVHSADDSQTVLKLDEVQLVVTSTSATTAESDSAEKASPATPAAAESDAAPASSEAAVVEAPVASSLQDRLRAAVADQRAGLPVEELSIETVRRVALENNLGLRASFIEPSIANEQLNIERSRFESLFSGNFFATSRETSLDSSSPVPNASAPVASIDGYTANLQLNVPLRTGGEVEIALPTVFNDPDVDGVDNFQDTSVSFSYTQPLLRNAGRRIAETPIEIARLQTDQEVARARLTAIQTLASAEAAYWDFYAASAALDVRYQQYQRALELERKARRLAQVDVVSDIEVTRSESGVARSVEGIIIAETERRTTQRSLKRIMNDSNLPVGDSKNLLAVTEPSPIFETADRGPILASAKENRQELVDLQLQLSVSELSELFNKNQLKPVLDFEANTTFADSGDSLGDSIGSEFTSWQIGANISIPLGNRAAKARYRQSRLQSQLSAAQLATQTQIIEQEVLDELDRLEQSWQRIIAAQSEVQLAARTYEAEERQFLAGVRTSTDVLESLDFLAEAQLREVQSLSFHERQKVALALATGTLLGKGQVSIEKFR